MYVKNSSPAVTNCVFLDNSADYGGGMLNDSSSPTVSNCSFSGNSADELGGGMLNDHGSPTVTNCTFSGNTADDSGGGMHNDHISSPAVTNCTFSGNSAAFSAGGMYNTRNSSATLTNCILWGDTGSEIGNDETSTATVTYSDVQDDAPDDGVVWPCTSLPCTPGQGNIDNDPLFVDPDGTFGTEDDDLRLQEGSPCIDAGDNSPVTVPTDLDGNPRLVDDPGVPDTGNGDPPIVDVGAYEVQACTDDGECDDGLFCNGKETCQAWRCRAGSNPCPGQQCNETNDVCISPPRPPPPPPPPPPPAQDGDGVPDDSDACPGTVPGTEVDAGGCSCDQLDDDADGVNNCDDDYPETPDTETPNASGCSCSQVNRDDGGACTDDSCVAGDCAHTPVDCDDGDACTQDSCVGGECLNTAVECPPDQSCDPISGECEPADSDGDGVADAEDECPGTPPGADVEDEGCRWFSVTLPAGAPAIREREGEVVVVPAPQPDAGFRFDHWEGDVPAGREHDNPLPLTLDSGKSLIPVYMQVAPVSVCGAGAGCTPDAPAVGLIFLGLLGLRFVGPGRWTRGRV